MSKKTKLLNILNKLSPLDNTESVFRPLEKELENMLATIKQTIEVKTTEEANERFRKLKDTLNIDSLFGAFNSLKEDLNKREDELVENIQAKIDAVTSSFKDIQKMSAEETVFRGEEIKELKQVLKELSSKNSQETTTLVSQTVADSEARLKILIGSLDTQIKDKSELVKLEKGIKDELNVIMDSIKTLEKDFLARFAGLENIGGGNANRNIAIGGNTSVLSSFTDINLKAGSNVTITYAKNNTTKYTDITISATGGGGSVGGVIRDIETISTSQTAGDVAGTDYVYICSAGVRLTLPTANANTNLYTVKNTSASSILVSPDAADTIDSDTNLILVTQYTAVDLVSNGTDNWNIT